MTLDDDRRPPTSYAQRQQQQSSIIADEQQPATSGRRAAAASGGIKVQAAASEGAKSRSHTENVQRPLFTARIMTPRARPSSSTPPKTCAPASADAKPASQPRASCTVMNDDRGSRRTRQHNIISYCCRPNSAPSHSSSVSAP